MSVQLIAVSYIAALIIGAGMGELLTLISEDGNRQSMRNRIFGIIGSLSGWSFAQLLPTLPGHKIFFTLFATTYGSVLFLYVYFMSFHSRSKLVKHIETDTWVPKHKVSRKLRSVA